MKYIFRVLLFFLFAIQLNSGLAQKMNNKKLEKIFSEVSDSLSGNLGYWQVKYQDLVLLVVTDETHNRMRIITPISYVSELDESFKTKALEANFHTALDVKYAISDGIVWSVFIHPLKELSKNQVVDALSQVFLGAKTFGGSYSSTNLRFPSQE